MDYPKDLQESVEYQHAYQLFLDYYEASNGVTACTYPGVKEALARWRQKGIKLAVVTNKPMQFTTSSNHTFPRVLQDATTRTFTCQ